MARLLIVDDVTSDLDSMALLMRRAGHDVVTCARADQALRRIAETDQPFDAVIVDIYMPEMDGLELIRSLRRGRYAGAILAVSNGGTLDRLDVLRLARLLGADEAVAKPLLDSAPGRLHDLIEQRAA